MPKANTGFQLIVTPSQVEARLAQHDSDVRECVRDIGAFVNSKKGTPEEAALLKVWAGLNEYVVVWRKFYENVTRWWNPEGTFSRIDEFKVRLDNYRQIFIGLGYKPLVPGPLIQPKSMAVGTQVLIGVIVAGASYVLVEGMKTWRVGRGVA